MRMIPSIYWKAKGIHIAEKEDEEKPSIKRDISKHKDNTSIWSRRRKYNNLVRKLTNAQDLSSIEGIEKREFRKFDLDHKISIFDGFRLGLPACFIAGLHNLRIITHEENSRKGNDSIFP